MIAYDGELINQFVDASLNANEELESAKALLDAVKSHNDWTCKEKRAIDEYMSKIRKSMNLLTENQRNYHQAIRSVKEIFEETERKVSNMFGGVEDWLKKILGIPTAVVSSPNPGFVSIWDSVIGGEAPTGSEFTAEGIKDIMGDFKNQVVYSDMNGNGYNLFGECVTRNDILSFPNSNSGLSQFVEHSLDAITVVNFDDLALVHK